MKYNLNQELNWKFSRSSGPGGQSVNKVNSKVELRFDVKNSTLITEDDKAILFDKLQNRINNDGVLVLVSQQSRSQLKNKKIVTERFYHLIESALEPEVKRRPTRTPSSEKKKRLEQKQRRAVQKELRKPPTL